MIYKIVIKKFSWNDFEQWERVQESKRWLIVAIEYFQNLKIN